MKKVYLIVSIDTECDKSPNWDVQQPLSFKNITDQAHTLFPLFDKYNIKPTYLLSPEVLKDDNSIEFFKKNEKKIELGTHLHVEFIKPNENMKSATTKEVQSDLRADVEFKKLDNLTKLFLDRFGYQPLSFRAGRFGISNSTLLYLNKLGYKVDSSYLPFKHLKFKKSEIEGWGLNILPYTKNEIVEVPVTHYAKNYIQIPKFILKKLNNPLSFQSKVFKKIYGSRKVSWLRPFRHDKTELVNIAEFTIYQIFKQQDYAVLNIMFHSNEITPNASPYCKTKKDVENYIRDLDFLFNHLKNKYELCSIGLGESYYSIYQNSTLN